MLEPGIRLKSVGLHSPHLPSTMQPHFVVVWLQSVGEWQRVRLAFTFLVETHIHTH